MRVAIVKYNAGNVRSVEFALHRLGVEGEVTDDPEKLRSADRVIFPGVGEAGTAMAYLRERRLDEVIPTLTQPVLGICLGLQLLCESSEEADTRCMGVFPHVVRRFEAGFESGDSRARLKVPQIGWNTVQHDGDGVFSALPADPHMYFVHSYFAADGPCTAATTEYGVRFASALRKDNFHAVQFHPEKSADAGHALLKAFLELG
ncbi:MAG: imidazole glycerol phosphate synthase subunit HisH [Rhodothermales bacterium]|nr:imidazole glycerol phosphate synthase subunit HisH [Rhodothermales bacterium]